VLLSPQAPEFLEDGAHDIWYLTARRRQAAAPRPWVQVFGGSLEQQMAVSAPSSRCLRGRLLHHVRFEAGAAWGWRPQPQAAMDGGEEQEHSRMKDEITTNRLAATACLSGSRAVSGVGEERRK